MNEKPRAGEDLRAGDLVYRTDRLTATVFAQGMALLAERWNREISPGMSRIYADALKDLGAELFIVGVTRAVAELTWFPSASEIRALARPAVPVKVAAGELFARVDGCGVPGPNGRTFSVTTIAERCGPAAALAFTAIGGAARLRAMGETDYPFALRDFATAVEAYSEQAIAEDIVVRRLEAARTDPILTAGTVKKAIAAGLSPIADTIAAAIPADLLPRVAETKT